MSKRSGNRPERAEWLDGLEGGRLRTYRGVGNSNLCRQPLGEPTDALPGSLEKMLVLERRASLGQQLWHPMDRLDDPELDGLGGCGGGGCQDREARHGARSIRLTRILDMLGRKPAGDRNEGRQ